MNYTNLKQDFFFELDSNNNIQIHQLINEQKIYYDMIDNFEELTQEEFNYKCKVWYNNNILR